MNISGAQEVFATEPGVPYTLCTITGADGALYPAIPLLERNKKEQGPGLLIATVPGVFSDEVLAAGQTAQQLLKLSQWIPKWLP